MHPNIPALLRIPVFGALIVFSIIVLAVDGNLISKLSSSYSVYGSTFTVSAPSWTKLGVAVAVLTFISLIPLLAIDILRKGAPTSFVCVELGWLGFLWIMWLATAASTASEVNCGGVSGIPICDEAQAAEAFAFLAWMILMGYWIILLVYTIIAANNGQSGIWTTSVSEADFSASEKGTGGGQVYGGGPAYGAQQAYYPTQQPQMSGGSYPPLPNV